MQIRRTVKLYRTVSRTERRRNEYLMMGRKGELYSDVPYVLLFAQFRRLST